MQQRLQAQIQECKAITSEVEIRDAVIAIIRITLQHACISLLEWLQSERRSRNIPNLPPLPIEQLLMPSDGTLISALGDLLIAARVAGWKEVGQLIWEPISKDCECRSLGKNLDNVEDLLNRFTQIRNEGVEGHGLPSKVATGAYLNLAEVVIKKLAPILPTLGEDGQSLAIGPEKATKLTLKLLRVFDGNLICYRKFRRVNGKVLVKAQVQLDLKNSADVSFEAPDILGDEDIPEPMGYQILETGFEDWNPLAVLPERLTENFTGRETELGEMTEWLEDTESRILQIYGDGGIGKTTLVLEWIHNLLESPKASDALPELITFFSAKRTRWGVNGLEYIAAGSQRIDDACLDIVHWLDPNEMGKAWQKRSGETLAQKLSGYLSDGWGIKRDKHLLILDNTETLITDAEGVRELGRQINFLARRVGRIIVTSRRREEIEARPLEILPLPVDDSIAMLRQRANTLSKSSVEQAGDAKLRKICNSLGNKPLLLEAFVQAIAIDQPNLDKALARIVRMQTHDLGEFLYLDAWKRMTDRVQHLLLLLVGVTDVHEEITLKLCCQQAGVGFQEALKALEESRGIARVSTFHDTVVVALHADFLRFAEAKKVEIDGKTRPTASEIAEVKRRHREILDATGRNVHGRVNAAFRTTFARAAFFASKRGNFAEAEMYYEEATVKDPDNGLLFDRFAYFLLRLRKYGDALVQANNAVALSPDVDETWFTKGLIEARLGKTTDAVTSLEKAASLGKPAHLCLLQMAYAYLNEAPPNKALARKKIEQSIDQTPSEAPLREKHIAECMRVNQKAT